MQKITNEEKAIAKLAREWHDGQKRKYSKQDYSTHTISVAKIYKVLTLNDGDDGSGDIVNIGIAHLHDVFEDTKVTPEEFISALNEILPAEKVKEIFNGVLCLTNVYTSEKMPTASKEERVRLESERIATLPQNLIKIKCCDIMHNVSDLYTAPFEEACKYVEHKTDMFNIIMRAVEDKSAVIFAATHATITVAALSIALANEQDP